ncbi:hypothetical protein M9H77_01880 [Catharanthus roseus]|uniref:Uncharacterized protein n=1 Tax=Catharanthus roseus TaxID=4058 RepID=A0ACC0C7A8_CATRO|nr:hypothetical protein M9H77_01880 [Catharanthus roseus]
MDSTSSIGKVASYFIGALNQRIFTASQGINSVTFLPENKILYHNFYEATLYLKFAHFMKNQAILEAFQGHDFIHVIDFSPMQSLQWPSLIQALALCPGGPPLLRITGIGPPSTNDRDSFREIGFRLAEFARSVNVNLAFRGVVASRLDDIKPWLLLNSTHGSPIELVLNWVKNLNPKVVTIVEQDVDHYQAKFLDRFTEGLFYYSTMFNSLEASSAQPKNDLSQLYIKREICNTVSCEGLARMERHEPMAK